MTKIESLIVTGYQTNSTENYDKYISEFEKIVYRYPEQWFNYYAFWKEQDA